MEKMFLSASLPPIFVQTCGERIFKRKILRKEKENAFSNKKVTFKRIRKRNMLAFRKK